MAISKNISVSLAAKMLSAAIHLVGTMIIARILTPEQVGEFAVAAALAGLAAALRNFGTSTYLIQTATLDRQIVGSAFAITAAISWTLSITLCLFSEALAEFFGSPVIAILILIIAGSFLLSPFIMTASALLMREQRFSELVSAEVKAAFATTATAVTLALFDLGALSLAFSMLVHSCVLLLLVLRLNPQGLTYYPSFCRWRSVVRFGGWATGITVATQLTNRTPELILARTLGVAAAGIYDKGLAMSRLLWEQVYGEVVRVLLPAFAEESRQDRHSDSAYLARTAAAFSLLTPLFVFVAFHADPGVRLLFGEQWTESIPIAAIAAVAGAVMSPFALGEQFLIGVGAIKTVFKLKLVWVAVTITLLTALSVFGLLIAATALPIAAIVYAYITQKAALRHTRYSENELGRRLLSASPPVIATIAAGIVSNVVFQAKCGCPAILHMIGGFGLAALFWTIAAAGTRAPIYLTLSKMVTYHIRAAAEKLPLAGFR